MEDPPSLDTEDLELRQVVVPALVDAVMADVDESFLDDERLESEDGFRVTVQEFLLLPTIRKGSPHPTALTESEREVLYVSLDTDSALRWCLLLRCCCFCWISAI